MADEFSDQSVAEAYLLYLKSSGIDYLFMNVGTDFAPLVEAYARIEASGQDVKQYPRPILGTHENLVIGMAHGAYLASRQMQAAMFHVNVGTANAACGIINAGVERIPLFIAAGRTPYLEGGKLGARDNRTNWGQEMMDQHALVREAVKWDYELRDPLQVNDVMHRAFTLAQTEPTGPVYLTLPREVLAEDMPQPLFPTNSRVATVPSVTYPDPTAISLLADKLMAAELPVISSLAVGADPAAVELLAEICERFAIGYVEELARYMNLPHNHPYHLGFKVHPVFEQADVLCFLESDVPWLPQVMVPNEDVFIAQCGVDPNFSTYAMRSHRSDLSIASSSLPLLRALLRELESRDQAVDSKRRERLESLSAASKNQWSQIFADSRSNQGPMDYMFLSEALAEILHDDCLLFNEYFAQPAALDLSVPGSYFMMPASGGLGWSLPAAVGAKIQAPEKTSIVAIGDGSYTFTNPTACHQASQKYEAPVLTLICNNAYWNAVDFTAKQVYPDGHLAQCSRIDMADIGPSPAFEKYAEASGGYGEVVTHRDQLVPALKRGLHAVESEKRQAVINVICA
ncbi:thiamine pyrophosphate-requiring protein [Pseudomaricurvus alkylphenolicus]|uniref:thiamine pyrophosphate-requiring protein n=1 Tax=Pseudomaricurvus alkylphenolicus TaxID=1306991 RepID=UPI001421B9CF|nr:thiamine pyrophosphate-requiring protein [Pseudomaricurvus alkylphenolicus]NIB40498.1 thiamine pyrophosphate-requiring protein [Pseudomaricurvus alkylphenolicus]